MEDILPGPVSQEVILDNSYHVSDAVWAGVDRGPLECFCGNRSMRSWFLSDAQKEILHAIGPIPDESRGSYPVAEFWAMPDEDEEEDEGKGKKGKVEGKGTGKEEAKGKGKGKEEVKGKGKGKEEGKGKGKRGKGKGKGKEPDIPEEIEEEEEIEEQG
ncbi:hypothetical protein ACET3Z_021802 [Daucus carota]